jgi:hypothetical protein
LHNYPAVALLPSGSEALSSLSAGILVTNAVSPYAGS